MIFSVRVPLRHDFEWIRYCARDMRKSSIKEFTKEYANIDWVDKLDGTESPDEMVAILHQITQELTDNTSLCAGGKLG